MAVIDHVSILKRIKIHYIFITGLIILFVLDILVAIYNPIIPPWKSLESTYTLFSLAIEAFVFLFTIGLFLLYRWISTGRENIPTFLWAMAFLIYSALFFGLIFQAIGTPWANMTQPLYFFLWRNSMIIWAALMYNGISRVITENKKWQTIPTVLILVFGYMIFIWGLFIAQNIELMMYVFLFSVFCPVVYLLSYLFWLFGKTLGVKSPKLIGFGFFLFLITYLVWAPTHTSYNYWVFFMIFDISLVVILIGFILLPLEIKINELQAEREV